MEFIIRLIDAWENLGAANCNGKLRVKDNTLDFLARGEMRVLCISFASAIQVRESRTLNL
jgi:hypothetical protein